jgi:hypothetical protein
VRKTGADRKKIACNVVASVISQCNQWGKKHVMSEFETGAASRWQIFYLSLVGR